MEISVQDRESTEARYSGEITLEVTLEFEDLAELKQQAERALEIERALPDEARTTYGNSDDTAYINNFIETRATNDALEVRGIVPVAAPRVQTAGLSSGDLYKCTIHVLPRPEIGLTSLDPAHLKVRRIAAPGISAKEAAEGAEGATFVDDEKVLRRKLIDLLDSELPEPAIRALADEYQAGFEKKLSEMNINPESYQLAHSLNEEQYLLMMARTALSNAHWNYALDAVFVGTGQTLAKDDLIAGFERQHEGFGEQLFELYDLRNELWQMVEKVRRERALEWLREHALK